MNTPIWDFLQEYNRKGTLRFHMPGHKGKAFLGCEHLDLTEIQGADNLYAPNGIIAESEENAARLFGSAHTFYSTEGASQCIKAMLHLAMLCRKPGTAPVVVAARNVHKAFVQAAACVDFTVNWLFPESATQSLCSCPVTPQSLSEALEAMPQTPAAVYITCPDYLGAQADIAGISRVCHQFGTLLLVDNAHGAYLKFLSPSQHPLDLGADMCCDSAHKTLPVLTGGAYLHLAKNLSKDFAVYAKNAMALYGSSSPSYLTLASLDLCNRYLAADYRKDLANAVALAAETRQKLAENGWETAPSDPLKLTILTPAGITGAELGKRLEKHKMAYEYADISCLVLMLTPQTEASDLHRLIGVLGVNTAPYTKISCPVLTQAQQAVSIRQATYCCYEEVGIDDALGRICANCVVSCPPAIPIAVAGEQISQEMLALFRYYGFDQIAVTAK